VSAILRRWLSGSRNAARRPLARLCLLRTRRAAIDQSTREWSWWER
jgi:hypothetical protein